MPGTTVRTHSYEVLMKEGREVTSRAVLLPIWTLKVKGPITEIVAGFNNRHIDKKKMHEEFSIDL